MLLYFPGAKCSACIVSLNPQSSEGTRGSTEHCDTYPLKSQPDQIQNLTLPGADGLCL
jgi:hypothetical protein